jgi:N-acetylglucosaminyl-diphospho-decaprenol L-rhamnosyltransferase
MSSTRHDLAIIIVSWNVRDLLRNCLESLFADLERSELEGEVWVLDNASADDSLEMVRARFPEVRLLALDENIGFAGANNVALRRLFPRLGPGASGSSGSVCQGPRYVLLLNPDTTVEPGVLGTLVAFMDAHPKAGAVGAQLRYPDRTFQHAAFHFPTLAQIFLDFFPLHYRLINSSLNGRYPRLWYERGEPFEIDHPLGAAMMVRARAITEVGGLDEGFFMYCEEIDWCWRMKRAGWRIYCVPQATVIHHEARSTRQLRDEMFVQLWQSRFRLFRKHYSPLFRWTARHLVRLGIDRQVARARRARRAAELSPEAYARQLEVFRQVRRMR